VGARTTLRLVNSAHADFAESGEVVVMQLQSNVGVQLYLKV
jgi:hypothetical protein